MKRHLRFVLALTVGLWAGGVRADEGAPPLVEIEADHTLSRKDARIRVEQLLDYWCQRFGVERAWTGDVAHIHGFIMGVSIDAELVVDEKRVLASARDPGLFLRDAAMQYVAKKLRKYLHPLYEER